MTIAKPLQGFGVSQKTTPGDITRGHSIVRKKYFYKATWRAMFTLFPLLTDTT